MTWQFLPHIILFSLLLSSATADLYGDRFPFQADSIGYLDEELSEWRDRILAEDGATAYQEGAAVALQQSFSPIDVYIRVNPMTGVDSAGCGREDTAKPCATIDFAISSTPFNSPVLLLSPGDHLFLDVDLLYDTHPKNLTLIGTGLNPVLHPDADPQKITTVNCFNIRCLNVTCASSLPNCFDAILRMENLKVENGLSTSDFGGAIFLEGPSMHAENVLFANNSALKGGAIYMTSTNAILTFISVTFLNCSAQSNSSKTFGGGLYASDLASASVTGLLCRFGYASLGGCLYIDYSDSMTMVIRNSTFLDSSGDNFAAGVMFQGFYLLMEHVYARNCSVDPAFGTGGFLYAGAGPTVGGYGVNTFVFSNSEVHDCQARRGGGLLIESNITISDVLFTGCQSNVDGGSILLRGLNSTLTRTSIYNSTVQNGKGGCIRTSGNFVNITDSYFYNCSSIGGGGCLAFTPTTSDLTHYFDNVTFDSCSTSKWGGGVMLSGQYGFGTEYTMVFQNSLFKNSRAAWGGGIYVSIGNISIANTLFDGCSSILEAGAIFLSDNARLLLEQSRFHSCFSQSGGAIKLEEGSGAPGFPRYSSRIIETEFLNNTASGGSGGGAMFLGDGTLSISVVRSNFTRNSAPSTVGGAIATYGDFLSVEKSTFTKNLAGEGGGAIQTSTPTQISVKGSTFEQNTVRDGNGGAFQLLGNSSLTSLYSSYIKNSVGGYGGAISLLLSSSAVIRHSSFSRNSALLGGGALYGAVTTRVLSKNTNYTENQAVGSSGGAALLMGNSSAVFKKSNLVRNFASGSGGAVSSRGMTLLTIRSSVLDQNSALEGGALYITDTSNLTAISSQFLNNSANAGAGGAINCKATEGVLRIKATRCSFVDNSAVLGGAVSLDLGTEGSMADCDFVGNRAGNNAARDARRTGDGGAVYVVSGGKKYATKVELKNLNFSSNAAFRGGALYNNYNGTNPVFVSCENCRDLGDNFAEFGNFSSSAPIGMKLYSAGNSEVVSVQSTSFDSSQQIVATLVDRHGHLVAVHGTDAIGSVVQHNNFLTGSLQVTIQNRTSFVWKLLYPVVPPQQNGQAFTFNAMISVLSSSAEFAPLVHSLEFSFCPAGFFLSTSSAASTLLSPTQQQAALTGNSSVCLKCPIGYYCQGAQPLSTCPIGNFTFIAGATNVSGCLTCGDGMLCSLGNFSVLPGYWSDLNTVDGVIHAYECLSDGCSGANLTSAVDFSSVRLCDRGYDESRLCSKCADGYYFLFNRCNKCLGIMRNNFGWLLAGSVIAWMFLIILSTRFKSIYAVVTELQFLAVLSDLHLSTRFDSWIGSLLQLFHVSLFNMEYLGVECAYSRINPEALWWATALTPFLAAAIYLIIYVIRNVIGVAIVQTVSMAQRKKDKVKSHTELFPIRRLIYEVTNMLDLCHLVLMIKCFQIFKEFRVDKLVVAAFPSIVWGSGAHRRLMIPAVIYTVIFLGLFPLLIIVALVWAASTKKLDKRVFTETFGWTTYRAKKHLWWFHILRFTRRFTFALIAVFLITNPTLQVSLLLVLTVISLAAEVLVRPYLNRTINLMMETFLIAQFGYVVAVVARTYMTQLPSATTSAIAGASVLLYLLCLVFIFPYELYQLYTEHASLQWKMKPLQQMNLAPSVSEPSGGSGAPSSGTPEPTPVEGSENGGHGLITPRIAGGLKSIGDMVTSLGGEKDNRANFAESFASVADLFNFRFMHPFLKSATEQDLEVIQEFHDDFASFVPTREVSKACKSFLNDLPKEMQYAVFALLIRLNETDDAGLEDGQNGVNGTNVQPENGTAAHQISGGRKLGYEDVHLSNVDDYDPVVRKILGYNKLAQQLEKEHKLAHDSIKVLINENTFTKLAIWIWSRDAESRLKLKRVLMGLRQKDHEGLAGIKSRVFSFYSQ